jgi:transcriptional regulator with XRE-family HTH domain
MAKRTFDHLWAKIVADAKAEGADAEEQLQDFTSAFEWARELTLARQKAKLSQMAVAEMTRIPQSEISRIESGAANPTLQTANRLAQAYNFRVGLVPRDATRGSLALKMGSRPAVAARKALKKRASRRQVRK